LRRGLGRVRAQLGLRAGSASTARASPTAFAPTIGPGPTPDVLSLQPLIDLFGGEPGWQERYSRFVRDNAYKDMPWGERGTEPLQP
jgi:hypothetical protein